MGCLLLLRLIVEDQHYIYIKDVKEKIMQNLPTGTPIKTPIVSEETKKRHGCLTAWLSLMILTSVIFIVLYLARAGYPQYAPDLPVWALPVLVTIELIQIICAIALFKWKKCGFWGYCIICAFAFVADIWLGVVATAVGTLLGAVILYALLNIDKGNKGWRHLN
jgi:hypothetical protein